MNDKHEASVNEINKILKDMREGNIVLMVSLWNEISLSWATSSVCQVHRSLYESGHIQEMVSFILNSNDIPMEDTAS